jgi:phage shock protein PspC (stress-responsive transcriptional regulator)
MIQQILDFFERKAFGVCEWWGRKLGIEVHKVRLAFIYLSCITLGSHLLVYLVMAFILENKHYFKFRSRRSTIWDL